MSVFTLGTFLPCIILGIYLVIYHKDYWVGVPVLIYGNLYLLPLISDSIKWIKTRVSQHENL